jgi:hypothetical protein
METLLPTKPCLAQTSSTHAGKWKTQAEIVAYLLSTITGQICWCSRCWHSGAISSSLVRNASIRHQASKGPVKQISRQADKQTSGAGGAGGARSWNDTAEQEFLLWSNVDSIRSSRSSREESQVITSIYHLVSADRCDKTSPCGFQVLDYR